MQRRSLGFFTITGLALLVGLAPVVARASSHSEAPGTAKDRLADDTDLYAWVAKDAPDRVTFVGNWIPLLEPNSGPNFFRFDEEVDYYINADNVGDAVAHVRYQFRFKTTTGNGNTFLYNTGQVTSLNDPDLNVRQTYTVTRYDNGVPTVLGTDIPVAPNFVGPVSMPKYRDLAKAAVQTLSDGSKVFAGPRDDPFFVDLAAIFDLLTIRRPPGNRGGGVDGVAGFDVMTIALQVPMTRLTSDGQAPGASNSVIGVYASSERPATRTLNGDGTATTSGGSIQVSRLGNPLVNEVVIALKDKDRFNATAPTGDGAFLGYVQNPELAGLFTALFGIKTPPPPRNDLVTVFLTGIPGLNKPANAAQVPCEMLRLNMAIPPTKHPNSLGILRGDNAGFPNGRRLSDDVVDIAERVVAGATPFTPEFNIKPNKQLGDGVDWNDRPFLPYFPYVAPPHDPLDHDHESVTRRHRGFNALQNPDEEEQAVRDDNDEEASNDAVASDPGKLNLAMRLKGPNPSSTSRMEFTLATTSHVTLKVFDTQGRVVRTLIDQDAAPGTFEAVWNGFKDDGSRAQRGVYFARLVAGGLKTDRKIVLE